MNKNREKEKLGCILKNDVFLRKDKILIGHWAAETYNDNPKNLNEYFLNIFEILSDLDEDEDLGFHSNLSY